MSILANYPQLKLDYKDKKKSFLKPQYLVLKCIQAGIAHP